MRKAFTAIELIIVVAVLLILMGMLMPVVSGVRATAKKKLAKTEIAGIRLALERYFADTGEYPPDNSDYGDRQDLVTLDDARNAPGGSPYAASLYYYLCGPTGRGIQVPDDLRVYGPYTNFKQKQLRPFADSFVVVDPWGRPYVYEEHRSLFSSKDFAKLKPAERQGEAAQKRAHNMISYDLFSTGPNGESTHTDEVWTVELDVTRHDMVDNNGNGVVDEEGEVPDPAKPTEGLPDDICTW